MHKSLFFVLMFIGALTARAEEGTLLWDIARDQGGWRAFGNGMLAAKTEGDSLVLAVDWVVTTYGVGAVFEKIPSDLTTVKRLVVEARSAEDNGTVLAPEWVAGEKSFRVAPDRQQELKADWETYTFEIPDDFPKLSNNESIVTGLRLLFINPQKPGRADVYFRNARLVP